MGKNTRVDMCFLSYHSPDDIPPHGISFLTRANINSLFYS